jgi:hypothetical protein
MGAGSSRLTLCVSALLTRGFRRGCLAALAAAALAGCGDDEGRVEQDTSDRTTTSPARTTPARTAPGREETVSVPADDLTTPASPEDRPGGAGDESPARTQALFTGRGGSVRPRRVQVPPFIAIRVELRSADGRAYRLRFGRRSIAVGGGGRSVSHTFDGLRPGRSLVGTGAGRVVIEASAEPGP